jgi:hypothetical protein
VHVYSLRFKKGDGLDVKEGIVEVGFYAFDVSS